jgi:hypothetical protein
MMAERKVKQGKTGEARPESHSTGFNRVKTYIFAETKIKKAASWQPFSQNPFHF